MMRRASLAVPSEENFSDNMRNSFSASAVVGRVT